jgi:diguanylate cyclase (GGDEF)-like protein/PAS domain S-box-containing protein
MRILLIEPDEPTRRVVEEALHRHGHAVHAVADAEQGWSAFETEPFPLVVMSWELSLPPSTDLCRRLLSTSAPAPPYILALVKDDSPEIVSAALSAGACDYLSTNHPPETLAIRLEVAARQAQRLTNIAEDLATLHQTTARDQSLIQNAAGLMMIIDATGVVLHERPARGQVLGYPAGSLRAVNIHALVHPDDVANVSQHLLEAIDHPGQAQRTILRFRHQDGTWRWLETVSINILNDLNVRGIVVNARDVTERQEQEQRLRNSEQNYRDLYAEAERQAGELHLLGAVREAIAKEFELSVVIRTMVEATAKTFGYGLVSFYAVEGNDLVLQHQLGYPQVISRIPINHGIASRVARTGIPVLLEDAHRDPDFLAAFDGIASEICVPIHDEGRVAGIFNVETLDPTRLDPADLHLMIALSEHLSIAFSRARLLAEVRTGDERFRSAFGDAATGMALVDADGRFLQVNRAFDTLIGTNASERPGSILDFTDGDDRELLMGQIKLVMSRSLSSDQLEIRFAGSHQQLWVSVYISLVRGQGSQPDYLLVQVQDITERHELMRRLEYQALHDPLTGLPNRTLLEDKLERALVRNDRRRNQVAVLNIDLDGFKLVNDSLGHEAGDHLLKAIAQRLSEALRPTDIIARLGGDEFAVFLDTLGRSSDAKRTAARLLSVLERPIRFAQHEAYIGASIGIAVGAAGRDTPSNLLRNADIALYRAKATGRGTAVVFEPLMAAPIVARLEQETGLRRAIEEGELQLHYQPEFDLRSGRIIAAEALPRWIHPTRGLIQATDFIPFAEETGLIVQFGWQILEEACYQVCRWSDRGDGQLTVAVNVSARQLQQPDLEERVGTILDRTGIQPDRLEIEISERIPIEDAESTAAALRRLRALGVRLAIDDFGTGYSSLIYLRDLAIGILKIDGSFIVRLGHDRGSLAIVRAMVGLSHDLGLIVAAEGIETEQHARNVEVLGIDRAQGSYFGEPVLADDIPALFQTVKTISTREIPGADSEGRDSVVISNGDDHIVPL